MSRLLDELRAAGNLAIHHDGRKGSLLDQSGHGLGLTIGAGSGNTFPKTAKGYGFSGSTSSEFSAGVQASLDLTAATAFCAFVSYRSHTVNASLLSKAETLSSIKNGYTIALTGSIYCALGDASGVQGLAAAAVEPIGVPTLVAMGWNGTNFWTWVNGVQTQLVAQTRVPTSTGQAYRYGRSATYGLADVAVLFAGLCNRVLTGQEVSRVYDEWLNEGFITDLPRRNFVQIPDTKPDWDYNAQGIVLDTDFSRRSDGKIVDNSPSNYAGTLLGNPMWMNDGGLNFKDGVNDYANFGNVTQLNGAPNFSFSQVVKLPSTGVVSLRGLWGKHDYGSTGYRVKLTANTNSPGPYVLQYYEYDAAGIATATTNSAVLRAGVAQHVMVTRQTGTPSVVTIYVDGVAYPTTLAGTFSATTSAALATFGLAMANWTVGGVAPLACEMQRARLWTPTLTAAQVKADYLKFAQKLLLRETFEDVPVTLAASVGVGAYIGQVRVVSGTYKCSETSDGKRWLECVTAGGCVLPQTEAFGTVHYKQLHHSVAGTTYVMFEASLPAAWNAAGQNGYQLYNNIGGRVTFERVTNGAVGLDLFYTVGSYVANDVMYDYWINRRPSDGRFTAYIQGGAFTKPTLIDPTGGSGSNPTASDVTYTTSKWMSINMMSGDKLLMWDPAPGARYGIEWWAGVLDPTKGEI